MSDDDLFDVDENESYYSEAAMKYLSEANEAREELDNCSQELKRKEIISKTFRDLNRMQFEDIAQMKKTIHKRNVEIDRLNQKIATLMGDPNTLYAHGMISVSHIKPDEIVQRTHEIHKGIHHDQMLFKRTGIYQNFDSRIAEVRDLFNLMLMQLNVLNAKNRAVTRTLEALQKLDVKNAFILIFFLR